MPIANKNIITPKIIINKGTLSVMIAPVVEAKLLTISVEVLIYYEATGGFLAKNSTLTKVKPVVSNYP